MKISRTLMNDATGIPALLLCAALLSWSCSDSTTGTPGGGGNLGVPSLTYTIDGTTVVSFSGAGAWPPSGKGVLAAMDSAHTTLQIAGYEQLTPLYRGTGGPEPLFNFIVFQISDSGGIGPGSYPLAFAMAVGRNIAMSDIDSFAYVGTSGSLNLGSVTTESITGTFSGLALRLTDFDVISISAGSVETPFVTGLFDLEDTAEAGGDFTIAVDTGTTPLYTWSGGPAYALSVFRSSDPYVPVWSIVTSGEDSLASPVEHGTVPTGASLLTSAETVLTPGVRYKVVITRTNGDYAYRHFTP